MSNNRTPKHLPVFCGEATCYDKEAGKLCRFVGTMSFGTRYVCLLYRDEQGDHLGLHESNPANVEKSMLLRLDVCKQEIR